MARYYSFETYWPDDDPDIPGRRYDVEDWFVTLRDAKAAMLESLGDLPAGSTGICYRRYVDGEMAYPTHGFVKTANGIAQKDN